MSEKLSDLWAGIQKESQIVVPNGWSVDNPLSVVEAVLTHNSIFNSDPALEYITEALKPYGSIKRRWTTGAIDANTGEYVAMD